MNMVIMLQNVIEAITIPCCYCHCIFYFCKGLYAESVHLTSWGCFVEVFGSSCHLWTGCPVFIIHLCFEHQLRQTIQRFCQEKLAPYADEIDKKNEFPRMRVSSRT